MALTLLQNLLDLYLEAAPWLLLGLLLAGGLKAWLPEGLLQRKLGRGRFLPILKATLIGAPLPLCSCGVLPAAMGLRRGGASRSATLSFMISTPETGPDSIALTYALLGPFMALVRPIAAVASALFTGLLNSLFTPEEETNEPAAGPQAANSACGCNDQSCGTQPAEKPISLWHRTLTGLSYAFKDIFDDIWLWLFAGLLLAALVMTFLPGDSISAWGSGLPAMLLMLLLGIPMYICATASTPLAAAMLLGGVSPGTVLVFLLAGPATNLATMGVIQREMGWRSLSLYLLGISLSSILLGLLTDRLIDAWGITITIGEIAHKEGVGEWIALGSGILLLYYALNSLMRRCKPRSAA